MDMFKIIIVRKSMEISCIIFTFLTVIIILPIH